MREREREREVVFKRGRAYGRGGYLGRSSAARTYTSLIGFLKGRAEVREGEESEKLMEEGGVRWSERKASCFFMYSFIPNKSPQFRTNVVHATKHIGSN